MDKTTFIRCGFAWLVCALFLYDGGKFVRAQEQPESKPGNAIEDATAAETTEETAAKDEKDYTVPEWFDSDAEFTETERMLFVKTDDSSATLAAAEDKLALACREALNRTLPKWLHVKNPELLHIEKGCIFEDLVFGNRVAYRQDPDCRREAAKIGEDVDFFVGYAQLRLDDDFSDFVNQQMVDMKTRRRLVKGGLIGGGILALLATIFGYLKMETATRGFYSRRLQTASLLVAIALLAILYMAGQHLV